MERTIYTDEHKLFYLHLIQSAILSPRKLLLPKQQQMGKGQK